MIPRAAKMLAKMVMKRESPGPKTNARISFSDRASWRGAQPLFLKPLTSFIPSRHSITSSSSSSIGGVVVFLLRSAVLAVTLGVVLNVGLVIGVPIELGFFERRWAVAGFLEVVGPEVGLDVGLEVGLEFGRF